MIRSALNPTCFPQRPPMPQISRPTIRLSLLVTPPTDDADDDAFDQIGVDKRVKLLDAALARVRELALMWFTTPPARDTFENLEPCGFTAMRALCPRDADPSKQCYKAAFFQLIMRSDGI